MSNQNKQNLLSEAPCAALTADCEALRKRRHGSSATADDILKFMDDYNAFINHKKRPFRAMRDDNMKL